MWRIQFCAVELQKGDYDRLMPAMTMCVVCGVDDGRINFADFCKLMRQQQQVPGDDLRLPEQDTRQVFRVSISLLVALSWLNYCYCKQKTLYNILCLVTAVVSLCTSFSNTMIVK